MSDDEAPAKVRLTDGVGAWQPIETAPRDGAEVLVCRAYEYGKAEYAVAHNYDDGNGWRDMGDLGWAGMIHDDDNQPTHWMPLPPPPTNTNGRVTDGLGPLLYSEEDPARLWAEIHMLRAVVAGPDGFATWKDAALAERERRLERSIRPPTEWLVRALVALAKRILAEANATPEVQAGDWQAGQKWHQLGHTSQHAFLRLARKEAGIPHDGYRALINAAMDDDEDELDDLWRELEAAD